MPVVSGGGTNKPADGLPKAKTGDSYKTIGGVTILIRKDGTIYLPNGQKLPKGSRVSQRNPNTAATINLPGTDDFLGFTNGVVVLNRPEGRASNTSRRTYRQSVYYDSSGRRQSGEGFGSNPLGGKAPTTSNAAPAATGSRGTSAPAAAAPARSGDSNRQPSAGTAARSVAAPAGRTPEQVKQIQRDLNAKGAGLVVDGVYGPKTQAAEKKYGGTAPKAPTAPSGGAGSGGGSAPIGGGGAPAPVAPARPGAPAAAPKPGAPASTKGTDAEVRRMFGDVAAFLSDPELGPILRKAAAEGWDQSLLAGALQQTRFWKTKGNDERKWIILNRLDNATARRQVEQTAQGVWDLARQTGLNLTGLQVHDLSVNALKFGWSPSEIREQAFRVLQGKPGSLDTAVATQYGYYAAFLDHPEVRPLLERAAREGWSEQRLEVELQKTNFWKTTTDASRRFAASQKQDPASAEAMISQRRSDLLTIAQSLGVTLDPDKLTQIATDSLKFGWNDSQTRRAVTAEFDYQGGESGVAGRSAREVKNAAAQYLVPLSEQAMEQWTEKMVRGEVDMEGFNAYLVEQAKSLFPGMSGALDKGITVAQYADPYKQMAARELELNPETIDLNDPRFRKMLDQTDAKGNRVSMTLSESAEYLRKLPEWQNTRGANEKAASLTENILKTFGAVA